jgi:hypothetical protein
MPIEDSMILAEYGSPKEIRFVKERAHMGYPEANSIVYLWLEEVMGTRPDVAKAGAAKHAALAAREKALPN